MFEYGASNALSHYRHAFKVLQLRLEPSRCRGFGEQHSWFGLKLQNEIGCKPKLPFWHPLQRVFQNLFPQFRKKVDGRISSSSNDIASSSISLRTRPAAVLRA